jgi:hypothetical protein
MRSFNAMSWTGIYAGGAICVACDWNERGDRGERSPDLGTEFEEKRCCLPSNKHSFIFPFPHDLNCCPAYLWLRAGRLFLHFFEK